MCSVVGCDSWRRSAQWFHLPENPEMRSQWIQFVAKYDEELFKESGWSGIAVCREHFLEECFEKSVGTDTVKLKTSAVPSVRIKSEEVECVDTVQLVEPLKSEGDFGRCGTVPTPVLHKEEAEPQQIQDKHLVNENCLLQLFPHNCPSCSCKLQTKKSTVGTLITLTQQCLQCEYRNEFTRQISAATEPPTSTANIKVTVEPDDKHNNSVTPAPCKEESEVPDEEEPCGEGGVASDENLFPIKKHVAAKEEAVEKEIEEGTTKEDGGGDDSSEDFFPIKKEDIEEDFHKEEQRGGDDDDASSEDFFPIKKPVLAKEKDTEEDFKSDLTCEEEGGGDGHVAPDADRFPLKKPVGVKNKDIKDIYEDTKEAPNYMDMPTAVRRSTKQRCNECGYFYHVDKAHICEHKLKPYACNMCGKRCFTKVSLKLHGLIHGESKIHTCKYCYAPFKTKQEKLNHQETHEDALYPFQCPDCPARFTCFLDRREHLRTHPEPREHKCNECGITFRRRHVLWRHMVVHTGVKPYKCSVCERGFNQPGHLKSHMRLHTGEKPYQCPHCDKSFNHNVSLKSHIQRYHTDDGSNKTDDGCDSNDTESDSCDDNVEKEEDPEEVKEGDRVVTPKRNKFLTGRPKGRPKRNDEGKSSPKRKKKGSKSQRTKQHSDEESEEALTDSSLSLNSEKEGEEKNRDASKKRSSKLKNYIDPDYSPERKKKKRRGLRKGRGKAKT